MTTKTFLLKKGIYIIKLFSIICLASVLYAFTPIQTNKTIQPVDYVNPYMGNISHLLVPTFPTIHMPHSMLRVYPERNDYTDDIIKGLPITVTSHRGSSAFNLSPYSGQTNRRSAVINYSYDNEKITPYSYYVYLDEEDIEVNYTLSHQSAIYNLNFGKNEESRVAINSRNGELSWDGVAISGYQNLSNNVKVYLYLLPEQSPEGISIIKNGEITDGTSSSGRDACIVLKWSKDNKKLSLRYGISYISEEQARKNLEREVAGKSFQEISDTGRGIWNKELSKIVIDGGTYDDKVIFYTSLYR